MINVYLVDDHPFVLQGLKTFLTTKEEIEIIVQASKGKTAVAEIKQTEVDIAVVDLRLPDISGIEVIEKIKETTPQPEIVVLSSFCEEEEVMAAIEAGALSYLMKDSPPQKLAEAILAADRGEPTLHPQISKQLINTVNNKQTPSEPLTNREQEVLAELAKGQSNKEIGEALFISTKTVKTHVSNILRKLDVKDRTQAAIKAIENNLIER